MLPLLSGSLREILNSVYDKHPDCTIVQELLIADTLTESLIHVLKNPYGYELDMISTQNTVEQVIAKYVNSHCRMISFRYEEFMFSYLPENKEPIYNGNYTWGKENREIAKPARLIQKLLVNEHKCKEFEDFSNWVKAEILSGGNLELVEGRDIIKYYNEDNYFQINGTLGNSCMRYSRCSVYFDIYVDNAKMLVKKRGDKIMGRAIVWEIDGKTYLDRIYTCQDYIENQFIDYAEGHGWYHRMDNHLLSDGDDQYWKGPEDNYQSSICIPLTIKLNKKYEYVPYVDSFRYYNEDDNSINTFMKKGASLICLSDTCGEYGEPADDYVYEECVICGEVERYCEGDGPDNLVWSDYHDGWVCRSHCWYSDYVGDYFDNSIEEILVHLDNDTQVAPLFMYKDSPDESITFIDGKYYDIDSGLVRYNSDTEKYELVNRN